MSTEVSYRSISKSIRSIRKRAVWSIAGFGILALAMTTAHAQVVSTPYGNLPYGFLGAANPYGLNSYGGIGGFDSFYGYGFSGSPFGTFGLPLGGENISPFGNYGVPLGGSSVSVVGSPFYGGVATVGPNGTYFYGGNPFYGGKPRRSSAYSSYVSPDDTTGYDDSSDSNGNGPDGQNGSANTLSQSIYVKSGRSFDLTFGWRGNPSGVSSLTVTLLDHYHLPLEKQTANAKLTLVFPPDRKSYAARYYRVDVQYTNGTAASMVATLKR